MARLSQEKIDEIRQSVDIVDVIGQYLPLQKKGANYVTICPFHEDTHPSMSISPSKQIFMCFVCHTGGNVFKFLQEYLHISYIEAVMKVAELGHIDLSEYHLSYQQKPTHKKYKELYDMHSEAQKVYSLYLNSKFGLEAKTYLLKRDFSEELIEAFHIGYAPMESVLTQAFEKLGYQAIDMVKSGLVIESQHNHDRFKDRIMFPLYNYYGEVVGFSGRIYKPTQHDSKYMNSPESDIFHKGDMLYHYYDAKEAVKKAGFVYLLEGFMDVIAMYKAGIENTVAIMGTALTNQHIQALKRITHTVYLCLDGDQAGQAAMSKATSLLQEAHMNVKIIILPEGKDPDEIFSEQGSSGLQAILNKTLEPIEFQMQFEYQMIDIQNYDDRKQYLEKICQSIVKLDDVVDKDYYIRMLAEKSRFSIDTIRQYMSSMHIEEKPVYQEVKKVSRLVNKYMKAEHDLLFYMLLNRDVAMKYEAKAGFMYNDQYRIIAAFIIDYYRQHPRLEIADFISTIEDEALVRIVLDISTATLPLEYEERAIDDYIATIAENAKNLKEQQLLEQFNYILDPVKKAEILQEILKLKENT